jgi:hypothetical protein
VRLPADRSGYVRGRGVLPDEQLVGADAELVTELDEQIEGRGCLVALDAGDVLVRDAQLPCKLLLGQLEGFPAGADSAADSRDRCLRHLSPLHPYEFDTPRLCPPDPLNAYVFLDFCIIEHLG